MPTFAIHSPEDPRVGPFRDLPGQADARRAQGIFIVEGERLLRRMIHAGIPPRSVLLEPRLEERLRDSLPPETSLLVCPRELLRRIVGYRFHRGVLACAPRPPVPSLEEVVRCLPPAAMIVVCSGVQDPQNLGGILRSCAAFGVSAVMIARPSCDPYSRQVLRVSIGSVFRLPVVESARLADDLSWLKQQGGFQIMGAVTDPDAVPVGELSRSARTALVLGSEAEGLEPAIQKACDLRVCIPQPGGIDSLNVSVAAGILLYALSQPAA